MSLGVSKYTREGVNVNDRLIMARQLIKKNPSLTKEQIIHHCREHLIAYKVPRQIGFVESLPKTNVGKILRRALREKKRKQNGDVR